MKCRMFALSLALGALLCLAPSAAALEPQPEAPVPDTAAASQIKKGAQLLFSSHDLTTMKNTVF